MAGAAPSTTKIKTRILILSDTHGSKPKPKTPKSPDTEDELNQTDIRRVKTGYRDPLPEADVVLHCGDLTKHSRIPEYQNTFEMLRAVRAPLKLVIAGNHDLALDEEYWIHHWGGPPGTIDQAWEVIRAARADGVRFLTEGVHEFSLNNGARLRVYASPYTPMYGGWAFQYLGGHDFNIPLDVDVAMTHGPPLGVLDRSRMGDCDAGCSHLFEAVHKAKPKIHCFGHIHEAWGSLLARWKDGGDRAARVGAVIDLDNSPVLTRDELMPDKLLRLDEHTRNDPELKAKREHLIRVSKQRAIFMDLTQGKDRLTAGEQTLFLNAAMKDMRYQSTQLPFLVDIDLPKATAC